MKKSIFFLTMCLCCLASCTNEKQFDEDLQVAWHKMIKTVIGSSVVCDETAEVWRAAIHENKTPSGKYCSDFNDALEELYKRNEKEGVYDSIESFKDAMQQATSKLNDPPSSRKDCYNDFVEIVSEVSALSRMATNPKGSLNSYNEEGNEISESIAKKIDQFKIKYAQIIKFGEE